MTWLTIALEPGFITSSLPPWRDERGAERTTARLGQIPPVPTVRAPLQRYLVHTELPLPHHHGTLLPQGVPHATAKWWRIQMLNAPGCLSMIFRPLDRVGKAGCHQGRLAQLPLVLAKCWASRICRRWGQLRWRSLLNTLTLVPVCA